MNAKKIGFTIGKYAPLHKGHQLVIETGLKEMDEFYIVIYDTDIIDIDIQSRANWIKKLYPDVHILFAYNSPKEYGLDDISVKIQMEYLLKIIQNIEVTHFYSSEKYGQKVADYLQISNRLVDIDRLTFPISSTKIRLNLKDNIDYLDPLVYNELKK